MSIELSLVSVDTTNLWVPHSSVKLLSLHPIYLADAVRRVLTPEQLNHFIFYFFFCEAMLERSDLV